MPTPTFRTWILASACLFAACGDQPVTRPPADVGARLDSVPQSAWVALGSRRIYFAHQSVGGNITTGIAALLKERPSLPLRLVRSSRPDSVSGGAIIHDFVGENGAPAGKTEGFAEILLGAQHQPIEIGMQKFCYADFDRHTDPDSVFAGYERRIEDLRRRLPSLQIIHVTAPLLERRFSLPDVARALLGKTTAAQRMTRVRRFNELLRARYGGVDPIFDLAAIEARSDSATGHATESLVSEYATPDGGHLNPMAERVVAAELLVFLAMLPSPASPTAAN